MTDKIKIYTKTGDLGETSLLGGTRVLKSHDRVEAYGTMDELNSFIGLIHDQEIDSHLKSMLAIIQEKLFIAESHVAASPGTDTSYLPKINEDDIRLLENEIDEMNKTLPDLKNFLLPGGHTFVSYCHIARTVCRRAERCVIRLTRQDHTEDIIIKFLNRLSDYLFVLSRKISKDLGVEERKWIAGK